MLGLLLSLGDMGLREKQPWACDQHLNELPDVAEWRNPLHCCWRHPLAKDLNIEMGFYCWMGKQREVLSGPSFFKKTQAKVLRYTGRTWDEPHVHLLLLGSGEGHCRSINWPSASVPPSKQLLG